ncbi:GAF domain-containing protein [Streptomyces sp. NPDC002952]|uniref:GAF domain-containing protein n=1 Tax=Streptomyces sp. NPDC002952 TaxID=3364673 RepID=UPI0036CAF949
MDSHDPLEAFRHTGPERTRRLTILGLNAPDAEATFDRVARLAARLTQAPLAMVNFISAERQMFRGMYVPTASPDTGLDVDGGGIPFDLSTLGREAPGEYGFCPHVVAQRSQLALHDVFDYPRFKGNPLVNDLNVRSYLGTPLLDNTGQVLGTVCVADFRPRRWDDQIMDAMTELTATLQSEFKLRDSLLAQQQELFAVFDGAQFPIMLTEGPDHLLRYANRKQGEAFGQVPQFSPARQVLPGLDQVGVFRAMDDALRQGQPTTLSKVTLRPYDSETPQAFSFMCTPVRTAPGAPFKGVLTVAMNTMGQAYGGDNPATFAANLQGQFEQMGSSAFAHRNTGR